MNDLEKGKGKNDGASNANDIWGGRFEAEPDQIMTAINASISFDRRLWKEDLIASKAHAQMLMAQNIISTEDGQAILEGLDNIGQEIASDRFSYDVALEDIHMHVEARLKTLIGDAAGRLHTARSRNDQVATDFRLWVRNTIDEHVKSLKSLVSHLLLQAEGHVGTVMPGFTHLQVAQPVTLGLHLTAYASMFLRDIARFEDARRRLNECPLGAAALAGTSFPIDRHMTAQDLGFDKPTENALDSVSDRDFALEYLSACATTSIHLSRLAEEMVIWASQPFSFLKLSDRFSTGSSIMPQKRNPDAAELIRGKSGRICANHQALLMTMKGLPLAYAKDSQEDKEPVFDTCDALALCIAAMTGMLEDLEVAKDNMRNAAKSGFSTATDLADWLVRSLNLAFRDAHHITGRLVKLAEENDCALAELSLTTMQSIHPQITSAVFDVLTLDKSIESRTSYGGTAPDEVKRQIKHMRKAL